MNHPYRSRLLSIFAVLALALPALASAQGSTSYGYVRTLEGGATILRSSGERAQAEVNQPLLTGDQIWTDAGSRLELVLADRTIVRLDAGSRLTLERLAFSADGDDRETQLGLDRGALQLVVDDDAGGDPLPRVDTPNVTVYVQSPGSLRIDARGEDWTDVVVRSGSAEVMTRGGSSVLQAGDEVTIEQDEDPQVALQQAGPEDGLERWGRYLEGGARNADLEYVDDSLRYSAAPLTRFGAWVSVGGSRAWRPYVSADWRPYSDGHWCHTPSGLTWISPEPWGWATYHYGSWDYSPGYGWVWCPGSVYSPAWVYWYWGPTYVGWCPAGYYNRYYDPYGSGIRFLFDIHGWAGGWDGFVDWNFVPTHYFGSRNLRRYCQPGFQLRRELHGAPLPQGIVVADTRPIPADRWTRPTEAIQYLNGGRHGRSALDTRPGGASGQLPEVNDFVARRRELPAELRHALQPVPVGRGPEGNPIRHPIARTGGEPRVLALPRGGGAGAPPAGRWTPEDRGRHDGNTPRARTIDPTPRVRTIDPAPRARTIDPTPRPLERSPRAVEPTPDWRRGGDRPRDFSTPRPPQVRSIPARPLSTWHRGGENERGDEGWRGSRPVPMGRPLPYPAPRAAAPPTRPRFEEPVVRRVVDGIRAPRYVTPPPRAYAPPPAERYYVRPSPPPSTPRAYAPPPASPPPARQAPPTRTDSGERGARGNGHHAAREGRPPRED